MKLHKIGLIALIAGITLVGTAVIKDNADTAVTKKADIGTLVNPGTYALVVESVKKATLEEGIIGATATTGTSEEGYTATTTAAGINASPQIANWTKTSTAKDTAATNTASRQEGSLALVALFGTKHGQVLNLGSGPPRATLVKGTLFLI